MPAAARPGSFAEMSAQLLDTAQSIVFDIWQQQQALIRQAIFWTRDGRVSITSFHDAASREVSLQQLRTASDDVGGAVRVFFFSESSVKRADGERLDVILLEVADVHAGSYGQRI